MKAQLTSRTPAVVDGILSLLAENAEEDLTDVQIVDGPVVSPSGLQDNVITVAPGSPTDPGIVVDRIPQPSLGKRAYIERAEVTIVVSSYSGDTDMAARRTQAAAMFNAVKLRVDANQTRTDTWDALYLGSQEAWHPVQSEAGATFAIGFTIVAEAIG